MANTCAGARRPCRARESPVRADGAAEPARGDVYKPTLNCRRHDRSRERQCRFDNAGESEACCADGFGASCGGGAMVVARGVVMRFVVASFAAEAG